MLGREHFVEAGTLDIEYLAAQRQNRLNAPVAPHFCSAAGAVALDDKEFPFLCTLRLTVCELPRQCHPVERTFAQYGILGRFSRFAGLHRECDFAHNGARILRILFEEGRERFAENSFRRSARLDGTEFPLGLSFKLDFAELDGDDSGESLENIVAGKVLTLFAATVLSIQCARKRCLETGDVRAAFRVVDVVGKRRNA